MSSNLKPEQRIFLDQSTLYVNAKALDKEQVEGALEQLRETLVEYFPDVPEYKRFTYLINIVEASASGVGFKGLSYIRVSEPMVYYLLIGMNPDGSERIEIRPNPEFIEPPYPKLTGNDFEDQLLINKYNEEMNNSTVKVQLPPIVRLSRVKYDPEQMEELIEGWHDELESKGLDPDNYYVSADFREKHPMPQEFGIIDVSPSHILIPNNPKREPWTRENDGKERKIVAVVKDYTRIMSPNCPTWIAENNNYILHQLFDEFSTDTSFHPEVINGVSVQVRNYPQFEITDVTVGKGNEKRNVKRVEVIFSPEERCKSDASFCLQMRTKNDIRSILNPNYKAKVIFLFNWIAVEDAPIKQYPSKTSPGKSEPSWVRMGTKSGVRTPQVPTASQQKSYEPIKTQVGSAWGAKPNIQNISEGRWNAKSPSVSSITSSRPPSPVKQVNRWAQPRENNSKFAGSSQVASTLAPSPNKFNTQTSRVSSPSRSLPPQKSQSIVSKRWADESPSPPRTRSPLSRNTLPPQRTRSPLARNTNVPTPVVSAAKPNKFKLPPKK